MSNGNGVRAKGNFSNQNHDTFDAAKHFIGVRLQQGVPLLDRDWNELEDTRRHFEWTLRKYFIGNGAPKGIDGFKVEATNPASNDFMIRAGRCMVEGYDVANESDTRYSQQSLPALPVPNALTKYVVYLEIWTEAVTSQEDPDLRNAQDINLETCIRDQVKWQVKVAPWPLAPGARATYVLAAIDRPANAASITANTITDLRRLNLTLADVVDIAADLEPRVETMEIAVNDIKNALTDINQKLGRLFWDVDMRASDTSAYFGATVTITVTVTNYLGPVAGTRVEFSADYGVVSPASAVTNAQGKATTNLLGVEAARPPEENELPVLTNVASKVALATRGDKSVFYSAMKFEPAEMSVISKY
ncbi:MAG: Ig-like domain-containing protein, partial [Chloroflexi bacterium]|nr:Ig-like domain-containing protein [Chloroflexota bacterium]